MSKVYLNLMARSSRDVSVNVDGSELKNITTSVRVDMGAMDIPYVTLNIVPTECIVNTDGLVFLDGRYIPEEVARRFYETLKVRFEGEGDSDGRMK